MMFGMDNHLIWYWFILHSLSLVVNINDRYFLFQDNALLEEERLIGRYVQTAMKHGVQYETIVKMLDAARDKDDDNHVRTSLITTASLCVNLGSQWYSYLYFN